MIPLIQTRLHDPENGVLGNCYPTVIACLLDKESPEDILQIQEQYSNEDGWFDIWLDYLEGLGYYLTNPSGHLFDDSIYMVSGKTERGTFHVCLYRNGELLHDPHPSGKGLITEEDFEFLQKIENNIQKTKEFKINIVVSNEENKYSEDEISKMFLEFIESKELICGGSFEEI